MRPGQKISTEKREEILRVYLARGQAEAGALAVSCGLSPDYGRKLASARGIPPLVKKYPTDRNPSFRNHRSERVS